VLLFWKTNNGKIDKKILLEDTYSIGFPEIPIGEFKIKSILGEWKGKIP